MNPIRAELPGETQVPKEKGQSFYYSILHHPHKSCSCFLTKGKKELSPFPSAPPSGRAGEIAPLSLQAGLATQVWTASIVWANKAV